MSAKRIVVVGTTTDYIDEIRSRYPGRALFVTDPEARARACEVNPQSCEELLCDLKDAAKVINTLNAHLLRWHLKTVGVTGYDCESLELAAQIARCLDLPFTSQTAVAACRNKFLSKRIWQSAKVACPQAQVIRDLADALKFFKRIGAPVVLKPLTGSGSELVFKCTNSDDLSRAFDTLTTRLARHPDLRMYRGKNGLSQMDSRREFVIETFIEGQEYSCDCILDENRLVIIRIAEKLPAPDQPAGTTLAYGVPARLPPKLSLNRFKRQLHTAARALGLEQAVFMVDFIVDGQTAYLLELTPRPGGDCLPGLIRESCGLDMLGLALDFAEGKPIRLPKASRWKPLVGMRLFAKSAGIIRSIDDHRLKRENSVKAYHLKARPGYRVKLPPDDYDSRILGHVIFEPRPSHSIRSQCLALETKLQIEMAADQ